MPNDLYDQIWKEEIDRFKEDTLAMWKTQYHLWQRADAQRAPAALLSELASVSDLFKEAHKRLDKLSVFFPESK